VSISSEEKKEMHSERSTKLAMSGLCSTAKELLFWTHFAGEGSILFHQLIGKVGKFKKSVEMLKCSTLQKGGARD